MNLSEAVTPPNSESYTISGPCAACGKDTEIFWSDWLVDHGFPKPTEIYCKACVKKSDEEWAAKEKSVRNNERRQRLVSNGWITERILAQTVENSDSTKEQPNADAWRFLRDGPWHEVIQGNLYLFGPSGNGKTYFANAFLNRAIDKGLSVASISAYEFYKGQARFDDKKAIGYCYRASVLVMDDADKADWGKSSASAFWNLMDVRCSAGLKTILTANVSTKTLFELLTTNSNASMAAAIMDRLNPVTKIEFKGESLRKHGGRK